MALDWRKFFGMMFGLGIAFVLVLTAGDAAANLYQWIAAGGVVVFASILGALR